MAYSTQRAVSDGTLARIELSIDIIEQSDVNVYYDGVVADPTTWSWESPTSNAILFSPIVPLGVEVLLQRSTYMASVLNIFGPDPTRGGNAKFTNATMDENFRQALFIAQEAKEGSSLSDVFSNLNIHGYKLINLGAPTDAEDAVNKAYVDALAPSLAAQVAAAQAAATAAAASATAAGNSQTAAGSYASAASASATAAGNASTLAQGYRDAAQTASTSAGSSATAASGYKDAAAASAAAAATSESNADTSETQAEYYAGQAASYGGSTPILSVFWFPSRSAIPSGYLPLDGQTFQRSTYPDAAAEIIAGTWPTIADATWLSDPSKRGMCTTGDGSTTCRLADINGKYTDGNSFAALFLRGDGNLSGGTAGVLQRDALQNITGSVIPTVDGSSNSFSVNPTGAFKAITATSVNTVSASGRSITAQLGITFDASGSARTATETRPANLTGVYCVKMAGAPINAGTLDLATLTMNMLDRRNNLNDLNDRSVGWANLRPSIVDLSTRSVDAPLEVGQTGRYVCAGLSSVPFHISTGDRQRYRLKWAREQAALGSSVPNFGYLQINNTDYANRFFTVCQDYGGGTGGGGNGYANGMFPGGILYCWDALEIVLFTDTAHKWMNFHGWMRTGGTNYCMYGSTRMLSTASAGDSLDTTTSWASLGTWVVNSGALTGTFDITREL